MTGTQPKPARRPSRLFAITFWSTIAVLALVSLGLSAVVALRGPAGLDDLARDIGLKPAIYRPAPTELERLFQQAGDMAATEVQGLMAAQLDAAFAVAHAAVPNYADFHYSVLGEYTELAGAVLGQVEGELHRRLFGDLDTRLAEAAARVDAAYAQAFASALERKTAELLAATPVQDELDAAMVALLGKAPARMTVTAPIGATAALLGGTAAVKVMTGVMAKKIASKVAIKAAAKGTAKSAGLLGGSGAGAAIGSAVGPVGTVAGAVIGAGIAWFATDAVVVNLDEYFNRADFEAELHAMIDDQRDLILRDWTAALQARPAELMQDVALKDLFAPAPPPQP